MNRDQARQILARWKPDSPELHEPEMTAALEHSAKDPELKAWFDQWRDFQSATCNSLRSLPVPEDLAARILLAQKTARPRFSQRAVVWLAAAAVAAFAFFLVQSWTQPREGADFGTFRSRMVRAVLREYRMDLVTNDLTAIRTFMARNSAPSDFELTPGLAALRPLGGGLLSWQGRRVSMVCLDGGNLGTLFLFVVPSDSLEPGFPQNLTVAQVNQLGTASWSEGGRTYVLAASASPDRVRTFL